MRIYNNAMISKLTWKVVSNESSVSMHLLRAKYEQGLTGVNALVQHNSASHTWKSIVKQRQIVSDGLGFNVADGRMACFWTDR